ncbi:MAG: FecCD family ABC transporter permease [Acidobacteriota bacterium]
MNLREAHALALSAAAAFGALAGVLFLNLPEEARAAVLWQIRLPEALAALVVGGALALSGLLFQLILRNSLADPYVLGVAGGAAFASVVTSLLLGAAAPFFLGFSLQAVAAFGGGMATLLLLLRASDGGTGRLLLAGVVANTAFAAGARLAAAFLSPERIPAVTALLVGYIPTPPLPVPLVLALPVAFTLARFVQHGRGLDLLLLSDDEAESLGLAVAARRREALILAALLASMAVAVAGMIGFVGLLVPHAARMLAGRRHKVLVPASTLLGAAFLLAALLVSKVASGLWILPVGVYTSLVGAPAFLFLLWRDAGREAP